MQAVSHRPLRFGQLLAEPGVVEELTIRGPIGFCAFHGGNLERVTDQIAKQAAQRSGASYYGVLQPKSLRHHIPSSKIDPNESPALTTFLDHCDIVVALHGYGRHHHWSTLQVGGLNRSFARHIAHHLRWELAAYSIVDDLNQIPRDLRGQHPQNPCNLGRLSGVQLELPPRVRGLTPLAEHWPGSAGVGPNFTHVNHLVQGLVTAAQLWSGA